MQPQIQIPAGQVAGTEAAALPKYFPQIDGLRTFAIFGVICFHLELPGSTLGWSGVWLFYVISGFLITGILVDSKQRINYFKNFYARRALRIFPIYFTCLIALYCVALAHGWPVRDGWYYILYLQNQLLGSTQFAPAFPTAFNHTWTLAVEEQFYLLWPLIVWFLNRRQLIGACLAMIVLAPLSRILLLHFTQNPYMAITPLVVNVDSLAAGGLMAVGLRTGQLKTWMVEDGPKLKRLCVIFWLMISATILLLVHHYGHRAYLTPTVWLSRVNANIFLTTLLSLWFATLIFYIVIWNGWLRAILSHPLLVHIGKVSYGIYIFHGLVLSYLPNWIHMIFPGYHWEGIHKTEIIICNFILPYLMALVSWHLLESPFLKLKRKFASPESAAILPAAALVPQPADFPLGKTSVD